MASVIGINLNIYIAEMYLQISSVSGRWCVRLGLACAIVGSAIAFGSPALAQVPPPDSQIVPDSTLGVENSTVNSSPNGLDTISGGARREGNLFHSFERFSIPDGRAALFNNGADIQNILTRVTGGSVSDIDGILAARGTANLFLLNPNGIIFGENASLRVGGSFIATTASSINFADGTQFSATPGTGAPLLTVSVPLGLQFGTSPRGIINRSLAVDNNNFPVGLQVDPGKTLGLIGGNINLEGSRLTARGGRVELGAVAAPGVVGINPDSSGFRFSFPTDLALGDILLTADTTVSPTRPTFVNVRSGGGGSIAVNARNLSLFGGSELLAGISGNQGSASAVAGDIVINAQGSVTIDGLGQFPERFFSTGIYNTVEEGGTGKGGNIDITTSSLFLRDRAVIGANTDTESQGDAGNIQITATNPNDSILLEGGSFIQTDSFSQSNAGNVTITADGRVSFIGFGNTGVSSGVFSRMATEGGIGKSGSITIKARSLSVTEGAQINTGTSGQGDAGNVTINADEDVSLNDNGRIFSQVEATGAGKGGDITIQARSLSLTEGAQINTSTSGQGNAGSIEITANDLTNSIAIGGGSFVETSSFGTGNAGNVAITADGNVSLDTKSYISSSLNKIPADSTGQTLQVPSNRRGGDINIKARSLDVTNGSVLSATTFSQGNAGNINLDVSDTVTLDRANSSDTGIYNNTQNTQGGTSKGGNISIKAGSLLLKNEAVVTASTIGQGDAGNIQIDTTGSVILSGGSRLFTLSSGTGNAGNITITSGDRVEFEGVADNLPGGAFSFLFQNSEFTGTRRAGDIKIQARSLSLSNGAQISTDTFGEGNAGNIDIAVDDTVTFAGVNQDNTSGVFSRVRASGIGNGGDINLSAGTLFVNDGAQVNAISLGTGNAGNVTIKATNGITISGFNQGFPSAVGSSVENEGTGNGGDINIAIRDGSLSLTNGGIISASILSGQGDAGNIDIKARNIYLDDRENSNRGGIFAGTISGNGGDIRLQASRSVRLRSGSRIFTSAGGTGQPGSGGNITIDSPLVIANANGNNDITANAFNGNGGRIEVNAQSIFGLNRIDGETVQSRLGTDTPTADDFLNFLDNSSSNDVAAISLSDPSLSGTVSFNTADIDPSRDIVELPTGLVDASSLVAAGCPSGAENRFTVAGRGGLPPAPADKLSSDALLTDWANLQTPETQNRAAVETTLPVATNTTLTPPVETITEATSWQYDRNGAIILTSGDTTSPSHLKETLTSCPSS